MLLLRQIDAFLSDVDVLSQARLALKKQRLMEVSTLEDELFGSMAANDLSMDADRRA